MFNIIKNHKLALVSMGAVALFSVLVGLILASYIDLTPDIKAKTVSISKEPEKAVPFLSNPSSFVELAQALKPAVVNISTTKTIKSGGRVFKHFQGPSGKNDPFRDFFGDDFFDRFFGPQRDHKQKSLGSGFIIDETGYILTNNHVIEGADEIKIKLSSEEEFDAEIIGKDPKTDIALIKIKLEKKFPVAKLGDSDHLQVGEWVMAIGNPFGLEHTVTVGIVSAKGRVIGAGPYDDFLQTDASINPGNSGGPLINIKGEVVGINTAIVAGGQGIGFAIPIEMAKEILDQLKEKGKVVRGWLGVGIQKVTPELAQSFGLKKGKGALVASVEKDGPADKAGIKRGDIILKFNGKEIEEMEELPRIVGNYRIGKKVDVVILRDKKELSLKAKIGEMPTKETFSLKKTEGEDLGMAVQELTPEITRSLGVSDKEGVVVSEVEPGSPADESRPYRIKRGDIIKEFNRKTIKNLQDYKKVLKEIKKGDVISLLIKRDNNTIYTAITNPE